jgi:citrate lyase subunit beta/citryl-CoA lyase
MRAPTCPRSYLFVPGNRPERFEKARAAGADAVIFDLEDAVPHGEKEAARVSVIAELDSARPAYVRINAADTVWFLDDIAALANHSGVAGIVVPKAETREHVCAVLANAHAGVAVLPIVETARGFSNLDILCNSPKVARILFGTLDFQIDLGIEGDEEELTMFRSSIVLASRCANLAPPVDGVSTAIEDASVVEAEARRGRRFGFGGKLCIHPRQVGAVHSAYSWSDAERDWAIRVLEAVQTSGGNAVAVDGRMVDMPVILKAERIAGSM